MATTSKRSSSRPIRRMPKAFGESVKIPYARKAFGFKVTEFDPEKNTIKGYAATWDPDEVDDVIIRGAFAKTIKELGPKQDAEGNWHSEIKICSQHGKVIGLPTLMVEDDRGLYVEGFLVVEVQEAREMLALAQKCVIDKMSIGYDVIKSDYDKERGLRVLMEIKLYEFSLVDWPANRRADFTGFKSKELADMHNLMKSLGITKQGINVMNALGRLVSVKARQAEEGVDDGEKDEAVDDGTASWGVSGTKGLPVMDGKPTFDARQAKSELKSYCMKDDGSMDMGLYKKAHVFHDENDTDNADQHKMQIGVPNPDKKAAKKSIIINPKAVKAAAKKLHEDDHDMELSDGVKDEAKDLLDHYAKKMGHQTPWQADSEKGLRKALDAIAEDLHTANDLHKELKSVRDGAETKGRDPWIRDAAARLATQASVLMGSPWDDCYYGGSNSDGPDPETMEDVIEVLTDIIDNLMAGDTDETKSLARIEELKTKFSRKEGRTLSAANVSVVNQAIMSLQALLDIAQKQPPDPGTNADDAASQLEEAAEAAAAKAFVERLQSVEFKRPVPEKEQKT